MLCNGPRCGCALLVRLCMAQIIWPRSLAFKQYETIVAELVSRVVSGRIFVDYRAATMLFGTSLVGQAALPLSVLICARCLWWPFLLRVRHSLSSWKKNPTTETVQTCDQLTLSDGDDARASGAVVGGGYPEDCQGR